MIEAQRFILAHHMGLGKSRSALIAAQAYDLPIWAIVPAGTIINWQREAAAAGVQITLFSWAKLPEPPLDPDYVLIVDEAHYAQGGEDTIRGKGFLRLADKARAVFMLTGTPLKNSLPVNLWPLLVAARHPLAADRSSYESRYCGAYFRSIGRKKTIYDVSGASNLDELHERTRDIILYKKKSECVDLPDKLRVPRQAEVSNAGEIAYQKTIERLREAHLERMADKYEALCVGRDELLGEGTEESDLGELEPEYASALVELGIYRHAASLAKVESAVEIAQEAREQGQGVLLFTAFRDTAERIATKLDTDCLTSEVTSARRQAMIDRFQAEESKALVATIGAGGIGINLTAAQVVVMVDRAWTPGDTEQAEDRAHRLGQRHNVTSIWLQYGQVDDRIDQLLELKQERIETILRGRGKNLRGVPGIRALAKEIMESVHTGKPLAEILGLDPAVFEQEVVDLVRDDGAPEESQPGLKKDGRLKGQVRRVRRNISLDEEVVAFLETLKASNQTAPKEGGYSGFLERLVRQSPEFQAYRNARKIHGRF
jgi:SNF2 family DNA or RNA helicase